MDLNEWSLVLFTMLAQMSAGIMATLFIVELLYPSRAVFMRLRRRAGSVALAGMAAALVFSFLHLGSPFRAYYALSNIDSSWLSLEIFFASAYLGLLFIWWMSLRRTWLQSLWMTLLHAVVVATGLILIYAMARVYMIPTVPLWDTPTTFLRFFATAFLLGPAALLTILVRLESPAMLQDEKAQVGRIVLLILLLMVVVRLMFAWMVSSPQLETVAYEIPRVPLFFSIMQTGLLILGALICGRWGYQVLVIKNTRISWLSWAFIFFLIAELTGRYFFYANFYRIGL